MKKDCVYVCDRKFLFLCAQEVGVKLAKTFVFIAQVGGIEENDNA